MSAPETRALLAVLVWLGFSFLLFLKIDIRKAYFWSSCLGWMFLSPQTDIVVPALTAFNKTMLCSTLPVAFAFLMQPLRFFSFRFQPIDWLALLYCVSPMMTSLLNDLGSYDGFSGIFNAVTSVGLPYVMGRIFFKEEESLKIALKIFFLSGLIYMPLCFFEIRFSPQILNFVYGQNLDFGQTIRYGGYRPQVLMAHGLELALWMSLTVVTGLWLLKTDYKSIAGERGNRLLALLLWGAVLLATILCRSTGALIALAIVLPYQALFSGSRLDNFLLLPFFALPPALTAARIGGIIQGDWLVKTISNYIDFERSQSVQFRFDMENVGLAHHLERMWFGWGAFGRSYVFSEKLHQLMSVYDSNWIISFSYFGLARLIPVLAFFSLPGLRACRARMTVPAGRKNDLNAHETVCLILGLVAIDNFFNNHNPSTFFTLIGAVMAGPLSHSVRWPSRNEKSSGPYSPAAEGSSPLISFKIARPD